MKSLSKFAALALALVALIFMSNIAPIQAKMLGHVDNVSVDLPGRRRLHRHDR